MGRRVAIRGRGVRTPLGNGVQRPWEGLVAGRSGAGPMPRVDPVRWRVKFACEVKGFDPAQFLDRKEIRRYDLFAQYAIGAAEQAVMDACLASNWDKVDLRRVGVIVGTGTGGLQTFEENAGAGPDDRSEEHTSELQSRLHLVCRLLLEKKKKSECRRYH